MRVFQAGSGKRPFPFAALTALFLTLGTLASMPQTARAGHYVATHSGGTAVWETGSRGYSLDSNGWWSGFAAPSGSPRPNAYSSCTGTITTTFTWTPSYVGDPSQPPTKAVVYQETDVYVSSSGSGTIDNGISGAARYGKKYSIKDNPGASFTATLSPSATIGLFPFGVAIASVKYRASASPLDISLAGGFGFNHSKKYLIGQRVIASLISGGLTPTSYNWTATGGDVFKSWDVAWNPANTTIYNTTATLTALGNQVNSTLTCHFKKPDENATITCATHLAVPQGATPASGLDITVSSST